MEPLMIDDDSFIYLYFRTKKFHACSNVYVPYARMSSAGSGFDIFSDEPRFPFAINLAISAGGLSVCLGLFYASILKAQAETEEDDKKYMSGR